MNKPGTRTLENELNWFADIIASCFDAYFKDEDDTWHQTMEGRVPAPPLSPDNNEPYAAVVREFNMGFAERVVLMLALVPHLRPQMLDLFLAQNQQLARGYSEFGGWRGKVHAGFLPTCESAAFLLAGNNLARRLEVMRLFESDHYLLQQGILRLEHQASGEPFLGSALMLSGEYLQRLTTGDVHKPDFSAHFPAKLMQTRLGWDDLVLSPEAMDEVENIVTWLKFPDLVMQRGGFSRSIKPGYRTLFYGPPGTGKTLTASLIGNVTGRDVYRIDLSMVVSKYIGETEKNLAGVFDQAQNKNWILFFDEADALFGKRTQTSNSNDRHANQEVSYLLQRVEDFPGVVILATNLKANIDAAFARRFQSEIFFAMPDANQRLRLWSKLLGQAGSLTTGVNLQHLAEKYELAGGALLNVVRYAAIRAVRMQREQIVQEDLVRGIGKELLKEGKTL